MHAKNIVIVALVLVLLGAVGFILFSKNNETTVIREELPNIPTNEPMPVEPDGGIGDGAEPLEEQTTRGPETILGLSVEGKQITAHHFGNGTDEILLIGGSHGGYSPNTSALTEAMIAHFEANEDVIPDNITLTIIPTLNPDGLLKSGAAGRFNAHEVDLNRNFDCEWSATSMWQNQEVSGGDAPFSEPEAAALRDYVEEYEPTAAIVWFSAEGKVYPSACGNTPSRASVELAATFATAAGYPAEAEFDAYAINGDMVNWMAKQGIPAISVLLSDYTSPETSKNLAGLDAVLKAYAE